MMRKLFCAAVLVLSATACKKVSNGTYEIQKPVIGTVTDTVHTPVVQGHMETEKVAVPKVEIHKDSETIKVPKLDIKKP
jgi:hypothetical protein